MQLLPFTARQQLQNSPASQQRFHCNIAVHFLRNHASLIKMKALRYYDDIFHWNHLWFTQTIWNCHLTATKVALKRCKKNIRTFTLARLPAAVREMSPRSPRGGKPDPRERQKSSVTFILVNRLLESSCFSISF